MKDKLTEFFRQAAFYRYHPKFQRREREYKLRLASGFSQSRDLLNSKPLVALKLLRKTFTSKDNNIIDWRNKADVVTWIKERPTDAALSFRKLWKSTAALEKRFTSFGEDLAEAGVTASGAQLAIISTLLMSHSAGKFPPIKVQAFRPALTLLDWDDLDDRRRTGPISLRSDVFGLPHRTRRKVRR